MPTAAASTSRSSIPAWSRWAASRSRVASSTAPTSPPSAATPTSAARAVAAGQCEKGILICTTGIGVSIVANKIPGIRCALCADSLSAELTRRHNNSNMLALGAGIVGQNLALAIVDTWLTTEFEGGRHQRRVDKITALEQS